MKLQTVDELRALNPANKDRSNEDLAQRYFNYVSDTAAELNVRAPDYYYFTKQVNPSSVDVNFSKYKSSLDPDVRDSKSDEKHAYDVFQRLKEEKKTGLDLKEFIGDYLPKYETTDGGGSGQYSLAKKEEKKRPYTTGEIADITGILKSDQDFTTVKGRMVGSFGKDEKNLIQGIKNEAAQYFESVKPGLGAEVDVIRDKDTKELVVFNPIQKKYQLVNKPGLDIGDFSALTGDVTIALGEILGTIGGAAVGGGAGGVVAGAAGATAGDMARMYIGHEFFNINPELNDFQDYLNEASDTGAISLATGTIFSLPGMVPFVKKLYSKLKKGEDLSEADFELFKGDIKDVKALQERINNKLSENAMKGNLKFSLGQVTNDPEFLAWQNVFEKHSKYGVKGQFHKMNNDNAQAMKDLFELFREGFVSKNLVGKDPIGYDVALKKMKDKAIGLNNAERKPLIEALQKSEDDLTDEVLQFPNGLLKEGGTSIKSAITEFQDLRKNEIGKKYEKLFGIDKESKNGLALRKVGVEDIRATVNQLTARGKETLLKNYPNMSSFLKLPKKGGEITFKTLHNTRSDLLRLKRNLEAKKISSENTPDEQQINQLVAAINKQMDTSLKDDPLLSMYRTIDEEAKNFYDDYNRFIGQLVQKNGGRLNIGDEDIFLTTFKKGKTQQSRIDDVYDVLNKNTEQMSLYKNNILEYYMSKVDPQNLGKVNLAKHRTFIQDHKYGLEKFFGKEGYKDITKVGNLQNKIDTLNLQNKELTAKLSKTTSGQIENLDPELIFDYAFKPSKFGGGSPTKLKELMNIIKDDDITKNEFKTLVSQRLMLDSTNPTDFSFNGEKFTKFLQNNKQNLDIVFSDDKKYLKNLQEFKKVINILDRKSGDTPAPRFRSALRDLIRAKVGMFTVAGRTMTAGIKISEDMLNKKMAQIIQNPNELVQLIELADKPPSFLKTKTGKALVRSLFGTIPTMQVLGVAPDLEDVNQEDIENIKPFEVKPQTKIESPTSPDVNIFSEQTPPPTAQEPVVQQPVMASSSMPAPTEGMGIANLPPEQKAAKYAGLFEGDNLGQLIAQRGQNGRT